MRLSSPFCVLSALAVTSHLRPFLILLLLIYTPAVYGDFWNELFKGVKPVPPEKVPGYKAPEPTPTFGPLKPLDPQAQLQYDRTMNFAKQVAALQKRIYVEEYFVALEDGDWKPKIAATPGSEIWIRMFVEIERLPMNDIDPDLARQMSTIRRYEEDRAELIDNYHAKRRRAWFKPFMYVGEGDSGSAEDIERSERYDQEVAAAEEFNRGFAQRTDELIEERWGEFLRHSESLSGVLIERYGRERVEMLYALLSVGRDQETMDEVTVDWIYTNLPGSTRFSGFYDPTGSDGKSYTGELQGKDRKKKMYFLLLKIEKPTTLSIRLSGISQFNNGSPSNSGIPFAPECRLFGLLPSRLESRLIHEFMKAGSPRTFRQHPNGLPIIPEDVYHGPGVYQARLNPGFYSLRLHERRSEVLSSFKVEVRMAPIK